MSLWKAGGYYAGCHLEPMFWRVEDEDVEHVLVQKLGLELGLGMASFSEIASFDPEVNSAYPQRRHIIEPECNVYGGIYESCLIVGSPMWLRKSDFSLVVEWPWLEEIVKRELEVMKDDGEPKYATWRWEDPSATWPAHLRAPYAVKI